MRGDLTTIERVKAWLAPDQGTLTSQNDTLIARLVTAVSRHVMNAMGRDTLARTSRTETYRGGRTGVLVLRTWPVLSVDAISGLGYDSLGSSSWALSGIRPAGGTQTIQLAQGRTWSSPAEITYTTGFVRTEELVVPAETPHQVTVGSAWLQDEGVTTGGAPVVGYTVSEGVYTLPPAQAGETVSISYSYVPEDIEQVVVETVGLLTRSRQHIGEASKALPNAGGTTSYLPIRLSDLSQSILRTYTRTVPS